LINRDHVNEDGPIVDTGDEGAIAAAGADPPSNAADTGRVRPAGHLVGVFPEGHAQYWHYEGIGDLRVLGRYQWYSTPTSASGVLFGTRLPTAPNDVEANDGLEPDKAVQPGAGSIDLILGAYYNTRLSDYATGFVQFTGQGAVWHYPDYRPPSLYSLDLGYRRFFDNYLSGFLQLNFQNRGREGGNFGLPQNSGGNVVNLSPGLGYELTDDLNTYVFVQVPIYQDYDGAQVVPKWSAAVGLSYRY
jgi:hypothetical protein